MKRFPLLAITLSTVIFGLVPAILAQSQTSQASPQSDRASDQEIKAAISKTLETDRLVLSPLIAVDVQDGVAILRGSTTTILAKERALEIAQKAPDVRDVVDQIVVKPHIIHVDSELKKQVDAALRKDARLIEYTVDVRESFVVLNGAAESAEAKKRAEQIVKGVVGVRGLESQLAVKPRPSP